MSEFDKTMDIIFGRWKGQILYTGAKIGIFDYLTASPKEIGQIARDLNLNETMAYRLLKSLASLGFLKEEEGGRRFSITTLGELLRKESSSNSSRSFASRGGARTLSNMEAFVKNG